MALWAVSSVFGTTLLARDVEQDLRDFMRLVFKSPDSFGFRDKGEAEQARLGRSYALYGVDEWKDIVIKSGGVGTANPDQAPDKLYEVLTELGEPRCVFSYSQASDGSGFRPLSLGQSYLAPMLKQLQGKPRLDEIVLLVDLSTRIFYYAYVDNPEVVHPFE